MPETEHTAGCWCGEWHCPEELEAHAPARHDLRNCPAMRALESLTPSGSEYIDDGMVQRWIERAEVAEAAATTPAYKLPSVESSSITVSSQMGNGEESHRTCNPQSTLQVSSPEILPTEPTVDVNWGLGIVQVKAEAAPTTEPYCETCDTNDCECPKVNLPVRSKS